MHIYARGHHPGDKVVLPMSRRPPRRPARTGDSSPTAPWPERFLDWFRDLGFLGKPGVETQAAKDVAANLNRVKKSAEWTPPKPTPTSRGQGRRLALISGPRGRCLKGSRCRPASRPSGRASP